MVEAVLRITWRRTKVEAIASAIRDFYADSKLWPVGLTSDMPCVLDWSFKQAHGIQKLATRSHLIFSVKDLHVVRAAI